MEKISKLNEKITQIVRKKQYIFKIQLLYH